MKLTDKEILEMKELNQEQHIQLLQFMSLMQTCKTEAELEKLKEQYFNIPRYEFLQEYISGKNEKQSFSSYKTSLIYDMDKYQQDYKFVYGENFPAYKKESMPNNKVDYTVLNLLNEISECDDILAYQKLLNEKNKFPKVKIEAVSSDFTGIFFSNGLPVSMILNSPESNFNAQRQLVEAGYSPFTLPSVEDVKENGFDWLHEEISHFKEILNPNFIKMETQRNQEVELNEYEEEFDDFVEQMDANEGMSSMVAEDDFNASFEEYEDVDEVQRQMDMDNGLIDENGNEIMFDNTKSETRSPKTIKASQIMAEMSGFGTYSSRETVHKMIDYLYHRGAVAQATGEIREMDIIQARIAENFTNEISKKGFLRQLQKYDNYLVEFDADGINDGLSMLELTDRDGAEKLRQELDGYKESYPKLVNSLRAENEVQQSHRQTSCIDNPFKNADTEQIKELYEQNRRKQLKKCSRKPLKMQSLKKAKKYLRESEINQNFSDISQEEFEKYIHSEEFISKFGDWEKASRLQKLSEAPTIVKNGKVIIEGEDITEEVNNFRNDKDNKVLRIFAKDIGRSVKGTYHNDDLDIDVVLSMGNIDEIKNHHMAMSGHLEAIQYIPDIIKQGIYIAEEANEDKAKHPNIQKYKYFVSALKIDGVDYTCKSAIGVDKDGNHYYDQRLSQIEKGLLLDNLSQLMSRGKSEQSLLNYDKRLLRICQCPQTLYLDKELKPTKDAVKSVMAGKLYLEKDKNGFQLLHDIDKNRIIGKELSEMIEKNMLDTIDSEKDIQNVFSNISDNQTDSMKVEESINNEINNEIEQRNESQNQPLNYENSSSNISALRPRNVQELHQFFINNPYASGTPVPTLAMRNEQTGHSTFIEGYEFARFEDIGKPNPSFKDKNGKQIKPDGQTVVLTNPGFKEEIDKETGEKKLVPDERKRKFIKISRELYEQAIKNSEIIAKRTPKNEQERQKMIDDYKEAANLDEKDQRANTASNFWHNYQAGVMTLANNKQEAMAFAKRLVNEMIPAEREKFATMVKKYEELRGSDGKHLSYDQRIIDFYDNIGLKITSNSIWRDHVDDKYNTLDAIKKNTEVFDKEGQPLDKTCRMKIGDTIKMSVAVDSVLNNKKINLPIQEYRLVAHSKDNNSVALISADGRQKIIKNREDFIKEVQKVEKKMMKKQQRQDKYESISM